MKRIQETNRSKSGPRPTAHPRLSARRLVVRGFMALLAAGAAASVSAAEFQSQRISPKGKLHHALAVDLDRDGTMEFVLTTGRTTETGAAERHLLIYSKQAPDRGFHLTHDFKVPDDVVAFALGDFLGAGRSQVVYLTGRSVFALQTPSSTPVRLIDSTRFFFNMRNRSQLPHWDYVRDLNGDGRDDLLLADSRGYQIYMQTEDHRLIESGRIEGDFGFAARRSGVAGPGRRGRPNAGASRTEYQARSGARGGAIVTSRRLGRLCFSDVNADGRVDLLTVKGRTLRAHFQSVEGGFSDPPDARYPLAPEASANPWDEGGLVIAHGDVNGDGRVDFVVSRIDPSELTTRLKLYLWKDSGIGAEPDQIVKLRGLGGEARLIDVNGDGFLDLTYSTMRADKMLRLRKASTEQIDVDATVHLYDKNQGIFSRRASAHWDSSIAVTEDMNMASEQQLLSFEGDFNADGVRDLLVHENKDELAVYACTARGEDRMKIKLGSRPLIRHEAPLPRDILIADFDADGKSDVALRYDDGLEVLITR